MFRGIRSFSAAILTHLHALVMALREISVKLEPRDVDNLAARVDELERTRALFEAEMNGLVMKAEQEKRNARNAEERARTMVRNVGFAEGDADGEELSDEELLERLRLRDAEGSHPSGVPAVREGVGNHRAARKAAARNFKFGR